MTTVAGSGVLASVDGTGTAAQFSNPIGIVYDDLSGDFYVSDLTGHVIRKMTASYVVTTIAGSGTIGNSDGIGTAAEFSQPVGLTLNPGGELYVADLANNRIREISIANQCMNTGTICNGDTVKLQAFGATSYAWSPSTALFNTNVDTSYANPSSTITYTVTGTDGNGCSNTATAAVNVNPLPAVTANASATTVCPGTQVTLVGGGALSYSWDNGVTDGVAFTPPIGTTIYTVIGTDANGCSATSTVSITVTPTITVKC